MTNLITHGRILPAVGGLLLAAISSGCSLVTDHLEECPSDLSINFVYDYNIKFADAFRHEVESVYIWAFDAADGKLVWSGEEAGDALAADGFSITTPLGAGTYDFVAWCGLKDHDEFLPATLNPDSKEQLEMELLTLSDDIHNKYSDRHLSGLYHGAISGVRHTVDPFRPSRQRVTIPLMKDTKDIRVMLHHLDGSPINENDFSARITYSNSMMHWDNSLYDGIDPTVYRPWNTRYGQTSDTSAHQSKATITSMASLLFEFSTGRLMKGPDAKLSITRTTDGEEIVNIPLVDYLLLVRN